MFIVSHSRATDRLYFGPFATFADVEKWFEERAAAAGVRGIVIPLIDPASDPEKWWD